MAGVSVPLAAEPVMTAIVSAGTVSTLFLFLGVLHRARELAWWSAMYAMWMVCYLTISIVPTLSLLSPAYLPLVYARETCTLFGIMALRGAPVGRWWFALVALDAAWSSRTWGGAAPGLLQEVVHFAVIATPNLLAAAQYLKGTERGDVEGRAAAAGFAINAATMISIPWIAALDLGGPFWSATVASDLLVGLGVALHFYRRQARRRAAAEAQVASALQHVIRGFVPICAYCHSLKDTDGAWQPIEDFIASGTSQPLAAAPCPDCAAGRPARP